MSEDDWSWGLGPDGTCRESRAVFRHDRHAAPDEFFAVAPTTERLRLAQQAWRLRRDGESWHDIGRALGMTAGRARGIATYPFGTSNTSPVDSPDHYLRPRDQP